MKSKLCAALLVCGFCSVFFCLSGLVSLAAEDSRSVKETLRSIASEIVTTGKEAMSGLSEGVEHGMGDEACRDKARLVKDRKDFAKLLSATVNRVKALGDNRYELIVALKNDNDFPVRLAGLWELENVVLLDGDGFSYSPEKRLDQTANVVALSKSLTRLRLFFNFVEGEPVKLRLYGKELQAPRAVREL